MKISQTNTQLVNPPMKQSGDAGLTSLMRAKESLVAQMQKLNQDKSIDKKTKQTKLKELQTQAEELYQQIQKRQMEKLVEDSKNILTEENSSSDSYKTAEEREKEASAAVNKSLISASVARGHLEHLGAIRNRLISEDGEASERVQRTERMMGEQTMQISQSLDENRKALQAYAQSSKEAEEHRQAKREAKNQNNNDIIENNEEISATESNRQINPDIAESIDMKAENVEQIHNGVIKKAKVRETEIQPHAQSGKEAKTKFVPKDKEANIDISI